MSATTKAYSGVYDVIRKYMTEGYMTKHRENTEARFRKHCLSQLKASVTEFSHAFNHDVINEDTAREHFHDMVDCLCDKLRHHPTSPESSQVSSSLPETFTPAQVDELTKLESDSSDDDDDDDVQIIEQPVMKKKRAYQRDGHIEYNGVKYFNNGQYSTGALTVSAKKIRLCVDEIII